MKNYLRKQTMCAGPRVKWLEIEVSYNWRFFFGKWVFFVPANAWPALL
jgi:hypothetical protein